MQPIQVMAIMLAVSNAWWGCNAMRERREKHECWASTGYPVVCVDGRCFDQRPRIVEPNEEE